MDGSGQLLEMIFVWQLFDRALHATNIIESITFGSRR